MNATIVSDAKLTKNQTLVFDALTEAKGPLGAYGILEKLRDQGFRAPLQVYRALDKLIERGLVHRLESLNAFVACRHPEADAHEAIAFAICDNCGAVAELDADAAARPIQDMADRIQFDLQSTVIELRGLCAACVSADSTSREIHTS